MPVTSKLLMFLEKTWPLWALGLTLLVIWIPEWLDHRKEKGAKRKR